MGRSLQADQGSSHDHATSSSQFVSAQLGHTQPAGQHNHLHLSSQLRGTTSVLCDSKDQELASSQSYLQTSMSTGFLCCRHLVRALSIR
jgi:hypothetical protein